MKTLNIKLQGGMALNPVVKIDGQVVRLKKNSKEVRAGSVQTDKEQVEITVENTLEIMGRGWWFVQMFFFFFSLFGILNPRMEKLNYSINYKSTIILSGDVTNLELRFKQILDKQPALELIGAASVTEEVNEYQINIQAKKRRKILKISRFFGAILVLGALAAIICLVIV